MSKKSPKEALKAFCPDHGREIDMMSPGLAQALSDQINGLIAIGEKAVSLAQEIREIGKLAEKLK